MFVIVRIIEPANTKVQQTHGPVTQVLERLEDSRIMHVHGTRYAPAIYSDEALRLDYLRPYFPIRNFKKCDDRLGIFAMEQRLMVDISSENDERGGEMCVVYMVGCKPRMKT